MVNKRRMSHSDVLNPLFFSPVYAPKHDFLIKPFWKFPHGHTDVFGKDMSPTKLSVKQKPE